MKARIYLICLAGVIMLWHGRIAAQVSLRLLLNNSYGDTIAPGDPVILELQLYNANAEYALIHNAAVRQNLEILQEEFAQGKWTQEEYDTERAILENSIKSVDPVTASGHSLLTGLRILFDEVPLGFEQYVRCTGYPTEEEYVLAGEQRRVMLFGIVPDETAKWRIGTHQFVITVDTLRTNQTSLEIVPAVNDVEPAGAKPLRLGYFYLDCGDPNEALTVADQLLRTSPQSLDAMTLKADAYLILEDTAQALEWYERSLHQFLVQYPDSYEAPDYLLSQIAALKQ
jgi:tetratricopeptide (TPR) repeat protein